MELPRSIVFDIVDEVSSSQRMFVADTKAQEIANYFLQQYYTIFNREVDSPYLNFNVHACFNITAIHVTYANK